jgi:hypothetical protein
VIAKTRCTAKMDEEVREEKIWWWKANWKLDSPLKTKFFLLLTLDNKILT